MSWWFCSASVCTYVRSMYIHTVQTYCVYIHLYYQYNVYSICNHSDCRGTLKQNLQGDGTVAVIINYKFNEREFVLSTHNDAHILSCIGAL